MAQSELSAELVSAALRHAEKLGMDVRFPQ
jgi:hypothetical protein